MKDLQNIANSRLQQLSNNPERKLLECVRSSLPETIDKKLVVSATWEGERLSVQAPSAVRAYIDIHHEKILTKVNNCVGLNSRD